MCLFSNNILFFVNGANNVWKQGIFSKCLFPYFSFFVIIYPRKMLNIQQWYIVLKKIQIKNKRMGVFFFIEKLSTFIAMEEGELVGEDTTSKAKEH